MFRLFFIFLLAYSPIAFSLQFTANAVMSAPGRADISSRIYYSPEKIRKEFFYYGEPVIQILNAQKKVSLMCFSLQKLCYENTLLEKIDVGISQAKKNPCFNLKGVSCEQMGEELLNKRKAIKWKLTRREGEEIFTSYVWVDAEINIPVKNLENGKSSLELIWLGNEILDSRKTQKWLEVVSTKDGVQKRQQWFDQELKISIKQTYQNGKSQELKDIKVSPLNEQLFEIPIGFKRQVANK